MQNFEKMKLTNDFVNLTDQPISLYDIITGEIAVFPPESREIPEKIRRIPETPMTYFVTDEEHFKKLAETGRPLDDIAYVDHKLHGRDGALISFLAWGKDPRFVVRLCSNRHLASLHS